MQACRKDTKQRSSEKSVWGSRGAGRGNRLDSGKHDSIDIHEEAKRGCGYWLSEVIKHVDIAGSGHNT